ncbi:hypothetical protein J2T12_001351 [Paenibacillus anaericanus]|uniref:hypothetical protein n=1 Tax=Paenibacillus TaxID=44249 RepID=UPI002780B32A|nr:hypothetical protein [Paenibacillus anaericanus]MDQ0087945.1 hypothetical protein [Paenibacillus anaericanus]
MTINRYGTRITLVLYLVGLVSTWIVFMTLLDNSNSLGSFWISLSAVLLAETLLWLYASYLFPNLDRVKRNLPGYLGLGVVILSYLIVVFVYSFFTGFSDLALSGYILIHSITLACTIIASGLILLYLKSTMDHEEDTRSQLVNLHEIESALKEVQLMIKSMKDPQVKEMESIIAALIEKVHYSDPVIPRSILHMDHELINHIYLLEEKVTGMASGNQEHSFKMIVHHLHDLTRRLAHRNEQVLLAK